MARYNPAQIRQTRRAMFTEINITPLTDIFLVLLIIMMVVAPMLDSQGLKLAVPTLGSDSSVKTQPRVINVKINAAGAMSIDGKAIAATSLAGVLTQQKTKFPDGVIIAVQPKTHHEAMVKAMNATHVAGIDKVSVIQDQ